MLRLPEFEYHAARTVREAIDLLAARPNEAAIIAGGTDLLPNMKRRQQTPRYLVGLRRIAELRGIVNGGGVTIGAATTLSEVAGASLLAPEYAAVRQAAGYVATPQLRNMGTIGGNLCLDTRCNYYDQNYEWRKAIGFCMKRDGDVCWVATSSPRCLAVSSSDTAPALVALGADVTLAGPDGTREIPLVELYRNDGIQHLRRQPAEIVTAIRIPPLGGWKSVYWKLRRRGSFDFPVLGVAAAARFGKDAAIESARVVLGAVASCPIEASAASSFLVGQRLTDAVIAQAADLAARPARPMDNTDFGLVWRKHMTRALVTAALRGLAGERVRPPWASWARGD
jgi:4-hydroxybenzoyl-CoA reductase subunit beta